MLYVRKTLFGTSVKGVKIITRGEKTGLPSKHNKGRIHNPKQSADVDREATGWKITSRHPS